MDYWKQRSRLGQFPLVSDQELFFIARQKAEKRVVT